jgi:hypothetical protein
MIHREERKEGEDHFTYSPALARRCNGRALRGEKAGFPARVGFDPGQAFLSNAAR